MFNNIMLCTWRQAVNMEMDYDGVIALAVENKKITNTAEGDAGRIDGCWTENIIYVRESCWNCDQTSHRTTKITWEWMKYDKFMEKRPFLYLFVVPDILPYWATRINSEIIVQHYWR